MRSEAFVHPAGEPRPPRTGGGAELQSAGSGRDHRHRR